VKAGIHFATVKSQWIPTFAGMTTLGIIEHPRLSDRGRILYRIRST
jgi:hypothetical protein